MIELCIYFFSSSFFLLCLFVQVRDLVVNGMAFFVFAVVFAVVPAVNMASLDSV